MISEREEDIGQLKEEAEDRKGGDKRMLHEHKEEIFVQVIFHKSMDLLICRILNNVSKKEGIPQNEKV